MFCYDRYMFQTIYTKSNLNIFIVVASIILWNLWFAANFAMSSFAVVSVNSRLLISDYPFLCFLIPVIILLLVLFGINYLYPTNQIEYEEVLQGETIQNKHYFSKRFWEILLIFLITLTAIICATIIIIIQDNFVDVDACVQSCGDNDNCLIDRAFQVKQATEIHNHTKVINWLEGLLGNSLNETIESKRFTYNKIQGSKELLIGFHDWWSMLGITNTSTLIFSDYGPIGKTISAAYLVMDGLYYELQSYNRRVVGGCSVGGKKALYFTAMGNSSFNLTHLLLINSGGIGSSLGSLVGVCGETWSALVQPNRHLDWFRLPDEAQNFPKFGEPFDMDDVVLDVVLAETRVFMYTSVFDLWSNPLGTRANYESVRRRVPDKLKDSINIFESNSVGHCPSINCKPYSVFYKEPSITLAAFNQMRQFIKGVNASSNFVTKTASQEQELNKWLQMRFV